MAFGFVLEQSQKPASGRDPAIVDGRKRQVRPSGNVDNMLCKPVLGKMVHTVLGDFNSPRVGETYVMVASRQHPFRKFVAQRPQN